MKTLRARLLVLFISSATFLVSTAYSHFPAGATTIIVLRHAEKDTAAGDDPLLTVAGMERAERLPASFENTTPDAFYSTDYIRTRETITPWAKLVGKDVQIYDPENLQDFAGLLLKQEGKTIVVSGHANTVPRLVNLLIGEEKYKNLADTEYSKIFVVTVKKGIASEKIIYY